MKVNINALVRGIVILVVAGAALVLLQMWFNIFAAEIFWKLLVTLVVIGSVVSFIIAVKQDLSDEKKLKDDKFLD